MVSKIWAIVLLATAVCQGQLVSRSEQPASGLAEPKPAAAPPTGRELTPEMRADIYMVRKMYREAAEIYAASARNNAVMSNKLGIAYHQMQRFDEARRAYDRAVKLNSKYAEAINNLGTIHYANKKYRKAANQYKKALKLSPNSASMYSNLGMAEFARKHYDVAFDCFQKAVELDPEVFERRASGGVLLQERTTEQRAQFHFYLAKTYAKAGAVERALLYIRMSLEEGFPERKKFTSEPEFATMQALPEFQELMKLEPRVL